MVVALSRFRVANGMQAEVARAFRERPRAVEHAPGFLWLEVFVDSDDSSIFYLLTRWTDRPSFDRWHNSPQHRESHMLIPKGLKLDAAWTKVYHLERLDGTTGPSLTEAVADAALLLAEYTAATPGLHFMVLARDGTIRTANLAARAELARGAPLEGQSLMPYLPAVDAGRLRDLLEQPGRATESRRLNFVAANHRVYTLNCWIDVQPESATLLGEPVYRRDEQLQHDLMAINQELAVLSRERSREVRDERYGREAAEKLNRERTAFLKVLAHELRQPLGSALAALSVLRKMHPDDRLESTRNVLERQLHQINRLVEDLTDTARVASGQVELRRADVDLTRLLADAATTWEATAHQQKKSFTCRLPAEPLLISADVDRLQQVFANLVGNALKYTPAGGAITMTAARDGRFAVVSVMDEGEGIQPEQLTRVFELFQRATNTGAGLGVGLAVVNALVQAHGGSVTAASPGLGKGATFTVQLPLAGE